MDQHNEENDKFIVKYRNEYYDISEFTKNHPGGIGTLKGLQNTDMTSRFLKGPPHSDAAMYLMNGYKIRNNSGKAIDVNANHIHNNNNQNEKEEYSNDNDIPNGHKLDESMEHMVDWSKAMLPQISSIVKHYDEWVHKPVDKPLLLFGQWYIEILTKTPWWIIPVFWIPVIIYAVYTAIILGGPALKLFEIVTRFSFGILLWTLIEYVLHRWVFHMNTTNTNSAAVCTFHFMLHGLHHKVPFDAKRLVFPPVPGAVIASILYTPLSVCFTYPRLVLGGALFGYLCYDLMHYYLHYGNPSVWHMYQMKRYHYQHHFAHQDLGYGISSPLWDFVFGTEIHLRKLKFKLKWR